MIAYLSGIVSLVFVPELSWGWWGILMALAVAFWQPIRASALLYAGGLLVATVYGHWQLAHRFEQSPQDLVMTAEVAALPVYKNGYYRLLLRPVQVSAQASELPALRLVEANYYGVDYRFAKGDCLELVVKIKPPVGLSNPAAFDRERDYLSRGIDARGYVRRIEGHRSAEPSIRHVRQYLADYFDQRFSVLGANTLRALILGDRTRLSSEQWQVLQVTGTAHLFVVSGLHVAVFAALGWGIGRLLQLPLLLWSRSTSGWRWLAPMMAVGLAGCYAGLSGWGIPVQRAWLMLAVFMLGSGGLYPLSGWQRWRLALVVIVTLHPLAILEAGLWLSFGAVALILWLWQSNAEVQGWQRHLGVGLKLQWVLFLGMLPLLAALFNQLSLLSVPVNLVAVPILGLLIWSLPALLSLAAFSVEVVQLINMGVEGLWQLLTWCATVPGLHTDVAGLSGSLLVLMGLAVVLLLLPMPALCRVLLVPVLIPILAPRITLPEVGEFNVWVFDVGQGQAVLIETAGGSLLYDTGPGYPGGGAAFPYAVLPWLERRGISVLETLVISHGDSDHAGGWNVLAEHLSVRQLYAGEPDALPGAERCAEQQWRSGSVKFGFYRAFADTETRSRNNRSCILYVDNGHCSLLLTGDLDASGEYRLLSRGFRQPVTWLVAGHHGSRDSTTAALLDLLQPHQVVISAGRYNRFGHPHGEVVARLEARGIPWLQTADAGAIQLVADSEHCSAAGYRKQKKRYWTAS
ncbi:DNA internalization-related competence protein ComEC/Rec2 [Marinobacterium marinum]|uniref:DNA internalization-related competence protein ComEC/Rec2 n=1 Tax=Marinobacterium marinum TaxID=2756129 RepID=A0A7W2ABZ8_9GAMM|nr:DNA internalization-related competence protein ComEC/Rec2 [Marinobacterium marinum]MBA4501959.1 DNA internalization-related competence protein ComEC/Rec2 [Marinobacterium marinum]